MKIDIEKEQRINDHRENLLFLINQAQLGLKDKYLEKQFNKRNGIKDSERIERYIRYVSQRLKTLQSQYVESFKIV